MCRRTPRRGQSRNGPTSEIDARSRTRGPVSPWVARGVPLNTGSAAAIERAHHGICRFPLAGDTLSAMPIAVSLRQLIMTLAAVGIAAKFGLFVWVNHTTGWTVGTSTLAGVTMIVGGLTMVLALIYFGRSRGHWVPLLAFILGLLTFVLVIGYAA